MTYIQQGIEITPTKKSADERPMIKMLCTVLIRPLIAKALRIKPFPAITVTISAILNAKDITTSPREAREVKAMESFNLPRRSVELWTPLAKAMMPEVMTNSICLLTPYIYIPGISRN
jgi:hypothetical protein